MGRFCWNQDQETNRPSRPVSLGCGAKVTALSLTLKVPESERGVTDQCDRKHQMVSEHLRLPPPRAHSPSCTPPAMPPQIIQFPEDQKVRAGESVELFGKVAGTQPITCTWMKFRKQVSPGGQWPKNTLHKFQSNSGPEGMRNVMEGASLFTKGALDMGEPLTTVTHPPNLSS